MSVYGLGLATSDRPNLASPFQKSPVPSLNETSSLSSNSLRSSLMRDLPHSPGIQRRTSTRLSNGSTSIPPAAKHPKTPKTVYPMDYGRKMRDMEIWDNTFFHCATHRHTLSSAEQVTTKAVILDLGCGFGSWAMMMARDHPYCRIVGFDIAKIQPNLSRLGLDDLAKRVSWVHGDMLKGLPFADGQFDLVRMHLVEFCVPETKWGDLFEEIVRVLRPGGIFETFQEASIFPCPRFAPRLAPPADPQGSRSRPISAKARANAEIADADPRDHSKLKAAYGAMLEARFLNPQIISTLPLYMNAHFTNVHMTPVIRFMMPPSSFVRSQGNTPRGDAAEPRLLIDQHISLTDILQMGQQATNSEVIIEHGGQMHLTQTMNSVLACKEAIWEQFEVFNPALARKEFDWLMKNWEFDMQDRIDMRGTLKAGLGWEAPPGSGFEDPERKVWRDNLLKHYLAEGPWDAQPIPEACRAMRAFTGVKPLRNQP